jgi:hypothetical protein
MELINVFIAKMSISNIVALHIEFGILPRTALLLTSTFFKEAKDPYEGGIIPEIIVLLKKLIVSN